MATVTPLDFFVSSRIISRRQRSTKWFKSKHAFFSKEQFSKSTLLPSYFPCSYVAVPISALLTRANDYTVSDCNTKISAFCRLGNLRKAMELLRISESSKLEPGTYCSILQLCAEVKSLQDGEEVHSIISSSGTSIDSKLGTKLVFMYITCGDIREGRIVFDEIADANVFLWNFLMNTYAKIGEFRESLYLFKQMLDLGIRVDAHTFSCVLKCFAALGSVKEGEMIHGYLLKLGFGSCNGAVNSLMAFYCKFRRVDYARKLFDELSDLDVISWNSMISGYVANGFPDKGLEVFKDMLYVGFDMDYATIVSVLGACANYDSVSLGRAVHAFAIKSYFDWRTNLCNSLLNMYSMCGDLESATLVFEKMSQRCVISWTSIIAGYTRNGLSDRAIEMFHEMQKEGVCPDAMTVTTVLNACASNGLLANGKDVHNYIRENGMQSNIPVCNALIDMYAKCGSMEDANSVFQEMSIKDIISWNTMLGGYSRNGLPNKALDLFAAMTQEKKPDGRTMACILPACASLAALNKGREMHGYILRNGFLVDQHVVNALADMYMKCGALVLARQLFNMIPRKDFISWTVMIAGYGMHGFGNEALAAFDEMKQAGIKPNEVSFISILKACCHSGLVNEGWKLFNMMQDEYKIKPKQEHYACVVELLARAGRLSMAYKFIKQMPIEPDATVWGPLLSGCRVYHDVKLAEKVAEHLFALEPENTRNYLLLANIYAEAEKWEDVKKLREKTQHGFKKNSGCSWIEVGGNIHIFISGKCLHPQSKKIKSLLESFKLKMKKEGYVPEMRLALSSAGDLKKEIAVCGHSEKLAMAFGLLSLPPGRTVRVTKNLKVCFECHEMAKFMSKSSRREIVLRDSNRFHHFKNGVCSCRGYQQVYLSWNESVSQGSINRSEEIPGGDLTFGSENSEEQ